MKRMCTTIEDVLLSQQTLDRREQRRLHESVVHWPRGSFDLEEIVPAARRPDAEKVCELLRSLPARWPELYTNLLKYYSSDEPFLRAPAPAR